MSISRKRVERGGLILFLFLSTLALGLIVSGFIRPEWRVEIEAEVRCA